MNRNDLDESILRELYVDRKLSQREIAKLMKCSQSTVRRRLCDCCIKWYGGKYRTSKGYIYVCIPEHPHANSRGYIMEHRVIMEDKLGRYLEPWEKVHHDNNIHDDNRPSNLKLTSLLGNISIEELCSKCSTRVDVANQNQRISEQDKRIRLLEWQIKQFNRILYDKDEPNIGDILGRGLK